METQTLPRSEHYLVPEHTMGALERYVFQRLQPGSFLTAVLSNDLFDTTHPDVRWEHIQGNGIEVEGKKVSYA